MKRINPETGTFFKRGDVGENGLVFMNYFTNKPVCKTGHFYEYWVLPEMFTSHKNYRAKRLISGAKDRAKKSDGIVTLDTDWVNVRLMKGRCELTGLPFDLDRSKDFLQNPYAPSIDRIDSENPNYVPENCRLVLWGVNKALGEYGSKLMLPILEALVTKLKQEQCGTLSQNSLAA